MSDKINTEVQMLDEAHAAGRGSYNWQKLILSFQVLVGCSRLLHLVVVLYGAFF